MIETDAPSTFVDDKSIKTDGILLIELFKLLKKGYTEAFIGLSLVRESQQRDIQDCMYVKKAYNMMKEEEFNTIINKMKEIINTYAPSENVIHG